MYYVYVLKSKKDGKRYTGMTVDLQDRLKKHNRGYSSTSSTKFRGPFEIVYTEVALNREGARKREKF